MPVKYTRKRTLKGGAKKGRKVVKRNTKKSKGTTKNKGKGKKSGLDAEISLKPALAKIVKKKSASRKEATKQIWKHIKANNLQGMQGVTCISNGRTYNGGQVIMCGKDPLMKDLCQGREKIAMTDIAGLISANSN